MWNDFKTRLSLQNQRKKKRFKERVCIKWIWESSNFVNVHLETITSGLGSQQSGFSSGKARRGESLPHHLNVWRNSNRAATAVDRSTKLVGEQHDHADSSFPLRIPKKRRRFFNHTISFPFTRTFESTWDCRNFHGNLLIWLLCSSWAIAAWEQMSYGDLVGQMMIDTCKREREQEK